MSGGRAGTASLRAGSASKRRPLLVAGGAALVVAMLGASATELGPWYQALEKPAWQPPDWLFGPAWTLIYALAALSAATAWVYAPSSRVRSLVVALFCLNALLNIGWTELFFGVQRPDWALYEVGFLWLSIVVLIGVTRRLSTTASWLLVPYLAWVTFASALNWAVVDLNAPFGQPPA